MSLSNNEIEVIAQELVKVSIKGDSATRLLIGNLVGFLAHKGVINSEEYLQFTRENKKFLAENLDKDDETKLELVCTAFELHINDLEKAD